MSVAREQLKEAPASATVEPLHVRYRPRRLKDVIGQPGVVKSLGAVLTSSTTPHSYLFLGPSGCGKTTLARIVARELGVADENILEVDAATNTGIDAMRVVTESLRYLGFGDTPRKMVILDECHALSKAAWQSMLKVIEEPPAHVFFALCTTEPGKVPDTVGTRCATYTVRAVDQDTLVDLLERVAQKEGLKVNEECLSIAAKAANGSPRKALVALAMLDNIEDPKDAALLLAQPLEAADVIELCRDLVAGRLTWPKVVRVLKDNADQDAEGIRLIVVNYLNAALLNSKPENAPRLLDVLFCFSKPMLNRSEKMAPLLLAFGEQLFAS
jgi:replication-associated recombination protein RarA